MYGKEQPAPTDGKPEIVAPAEQPVAPTVEPVEIVPPTIVEKPEPVETPLVEPVQKSYEITLKTNVKDVEVTLGNEVVCKTTDSECKLVLSESNEAVELIFRKRGYKETRQYVLLDSDQTIEIELIKRKPKKKPIEPEKKGLFITSE